MTSLKARTSELTATLAATALLAIGVLLRPHWNNNDDVYLSMISGGYVLASEPAANLIYPNIALGYLVKGLANVIGPLAYGAFTYLMLWLAAGACLRAVVRHPDGRPWAWAGFALLLLPAFVSPQFTTTAGLLSLGAVALALEYLQTRRVATLAMAAGMLILGVALRANVSILVLVLSVPLLASRLKQIDARAVVAAATVMLVLLALGVVHERVQVQTPEWSSYTERHRAIAPFADYGYGRSMLARAPEQVQTQLSVNDVELLTGFFQAHEGLGDTEPIDRLVSEFGVWRHLAFNLGEIPAALTKLGALRPSPILLLAMVLALLNRDRRGAVGIGLFFALFIGFTLLGRPLPDRVVYPGALALVLMQLTTMQPRARTDRLVVAALLSVGLAVAAVAVKKHWSKTVRGRQVAEDVKILSEAERSAYVWLGGAIQLDALYPVFDSENPTKGRWRFIGSVYGLPTTPPAEDGERTGFTERLLRGESLPLVTSEQNLPLLERYFTEHHGRPLRVTGERRLRHFTVYEIVLAETVVAE